MLLSLRDLGNKEIKPDVSLHEDTFIQEQSRDIESVGLLAGFKCRHSDDPFDDNPPGFERITDDTREMLGQICSYANAYMAAQFCTHVFFMLVFPRYARLLVWDRTRVTVTEKIDLETNTSVLAEFFWQYHNISLTKQGYDDTVRVVSATDVKQVVPEALKMLGVDDNTRLFEMSLPKNRKFVISAPGYMGTASPTGRSTHTFKALCMQSKKFVFLKDTWHVISDGLLPGREIYTKLVEAQVPHVARLEAFHDVEGQFTKIHEFRSESWVKLEGFRRFRRSQHYRPVLYEFARPIQVFKNVRELVQAFRDALEGKKPISIFGPN